MARPNRYNFSDLPLTTYSGWDRVNQIETALNGLERGQFQYAALLSDAVQRDDRIGGCINTRVGGLLASPIEIKASMDRAKARRAARVLGGDDDEQGIWDRVVPQATERELVLWGLLLGIGVAEIIWNTDNETGMWIPRLKPWHPQFIYWDWANRRYKLMTQGGTVDLPDVSAQPRSDGKWLVWCPYGHQYGWLRGLIRPLAEKYLMRRWNYRDWARFNEKNGTPIERVRVPAGAAEEDKQKLFTDMQNRGSCAVIELPRGEDESHSYDVDMLEAQARTWDTFRLFKSELDVDIAIAVLGQNLTTEVNGGSFAAAQVQNQIRIDKRKEDAAIATAIRDQVLSWWAEYNFGDSALAPIVSRQVEPPEDGVAKSTTLKTVGDALGALALADAPVDARAVLEQFGVPMISEEEHAAMLEDERAEQAAAQAEAQARLEQANAQKVGEAKPEEKAPEGEGAALRAEPFRDGDTVALSAASLMRSRPKHYGDRVVQRAVPLAKRALSADLKEIKRLVSEADSFEQVKFKLKAYFKDMDPKAFARVVARARLMAHLGGRSTAIKDL